MFLIAIFHVYTLTYHKLVLTVHAVKKDTQQNRSGQKISKQAMYLGQSTQYIETTKQTATFHSCFTLFFQ